MVGSCFVKRDCGRILIPCTLWADQFTMWTIIDYALCSHVYFLLIVAMLLLFWCQIVLWWHQVTMVTSEQHLYQTKVLPKNLQQEVYLFCYCPLVGILFEVLRIDYAMCSVILCKSYVFLLNMTIYPPKGSCIPILCHDMT